MIHESALAIYSEDLPPLLTEICQAIGWKSTLTLVETHGGTDLFVPSIFHADLPIVKLIHADAAQTLIAKYGGTKIYIARLAQAMRNIRNKQIAERLATESAAALAREFQISERQIWNIAKCPHTLREMQPDLFGS